MPALSCLAKSSSPGSMTWASLSGGRPGPEAVGAVGAVLVVVMGCAGLGAGAGLLLEMEVDWNSSRTSACL